jgi:Pectate lyase superfamily protein
VAMTVPLPLPSIPWVLTQDGRPTQGFAQWAASIRASASAGGSSTTFVNITAPAYGGVGDGVTDNTGALAAAIAALGTTGGTIYFPKGKYLFAGLQTVTYPAADAIFDLTLLGDGQDASILYWANSAGIKVNYNSNVNECAQSFHARDLTLSIGHTPVGGNTAVLLNQTNTNSGNFSATNEFTRVTFRGDDGVAGGVFGWDIAVDVNNVSNVAVVGCLLHGESTFGGTAAVRVAGVSLTQIGVQLTVENTTVNAYAAGIYYGDFWQGVNVTNSDISCTNGIHCPAGLSASDSALEVTNSYFNQYTNGGQGILIETYLNDLQVCNSLFFMVHINTGGIDLVQASNTVITGNIFEGAGAPLAGTTGVSITTSEASTSAIIDGNLFIGLVTGLALQAGAKHVNYGINHYQTCTANVSNGAAAANGNVAIWLFPQNIGYSHIVGNTGAGVNDHGPLVVAGPTGTTDTSSKFLDFWDPTVATNYGAIRRNGAGLAIDGLLWQAFTPTISGSTGGTPSTTLTGCAFTQIGKTVLYRVDITINAVSGATGTTQFTLPVTGLSPGSVAPGVNTNGFFMIQAVAASATAMNIFKYDASSQLAAGDRYIIQGSYEAA